MTAYNFNLIDNISPWEAGHVYVARAYLDLATIPGSPNPGLVNGDTVTATNIIPDNGVEIMEVICSHPELDAATVSTPTFAYSVGDSVDAARFILTAAGAMNGVTNAGVQVRNGINTYASDKGIITKGAGYIYSAKDSLIMTVTTGATLKVVAGFVHVLVTYRCVGNS